MSYRVFLVICTVHVGYAPDGSREDRLAGNIPIGIYYTYESVIKILGIDVLHAVSIFCEHINHPLLVLRFPPSAPWVIVDDRLDVVPDVLHVTDLVV
jgi:hypothetical protein